MKKTASIVGLVAIIVTCLSVVVKNLFIAEDDGYRSARERSLIKKFDKDGDGELNREERKAIEKASLERKQAYIKKFDKDGDGKLSKSEAEAAEKASGKWKLQPATLKKASSSKSAKKGERSLNRK
jgi:Ca2+-binding EF-hand superfamily protein